MHMVNCLNGELIEKYCGGHADIFQGKHKDRLVAIKVVRLYQTSDFDRCHSVKTLSLYLAETISDYGVYRCSAEKLLRGGISGTRTYCHC